MKLKAVLTEDEFGELEEATKGIYAQGEDGKYVIDVDGVDDLPQVKGLKNGHKNSKRERDEAKRQAEALKRKLGPLADLDDFDLSDADQERLEKLLPYLKGEAEIPDDDDDSRAKPKGKDKDSHIDVEKIKQTARRPLERDLETVTAERDTLKTQLQSVITDNALTAALDEVKVATPFKRAVKAMFRDRVKIIEGDNGAPTAIIEGEYGDELPVTKYLKEWAQTDEGKEFVEAPGNQGGGAKGGGDANGLIKNPWSTKHWSPKEQGRIYNDLGPDIARRMAAEHGKKVL